MARRRSSRLIQQQLRRRHRQRLALAALVVLLVAAVALDRLGVFRYQGNDWAAFDQQMFVVVRVIDGDTVRIAPPGNGRETRVRLWGIDAPEMNYRTDDPPEHWAEEATIWLRERVEGQEVLIRLEATQTRDRYDRLLAYLYVNDTENINHTLIRKGHARADRRFDHTLRRQFEQAEHEARRRQLGLWKDRLAEPVPP